MTECERIIKKGIISEDYLKEETICDFKVTTERKKLFAVLLDLLVEFDKICKKHNLRYFMDGGSLLGTIRHQGFIPWDDDIDVVMPRKDYDEFIKLTKEFKSPYFLQNAYTDKDFYYAPTRVRNTNTTGLVKMFACRGFNQGIWLTIFPLDKISNDDGENNYHRINELNKENSTYMRINNPYLSEKDKLRVNNYSGRNPMDTYKEIHRIASLHENEETDYVGTMIITVVDFKRKLLPAKAFDQCIYKSFEGYDVPVPIGYDDVLKTEYGDYMKLPPMDDRGLWHTGTIFDADLPYAEYLKQFLK